MACRSCLFTMLAMQPAARARVPPCPGASSMLWMGMPTGMSFRGRVLPGLMGAPSPLCTVSPGVRPVGARM
jgi:hypothetical protein